MHSSGGSLGILQRSCDLYPHRNSYGNFSRQYALLYTKSFKCMRNNVFHMTSCHVKFIWNSLLHDLLSFTKQDGKKPSEPVEEIHEELMSDVNDHEGSKTTSGTTQHDKLYTAEGILDPRKRKAEKKRRKANKFSALSDMDADYDFKVDYQMQDAAADGEDDESYGAPANGKDGGDETKDNDPMTGVNDA